MKCVLKPNSGVSLLELTFAAGVLAMALSLLFGALISITLVGRLNEEKAIASIELASVLEEVRDMSLDQLKAYEAPTLDQPGVKRAMSILCYNASGDQIALPLSEDDAAEFEAEDLPNPLEVEATLLWSNAKGHIFRSSAITSVSR